MVKVTVGVEKAIDLSFMPSLQCDLTCAHCMYNSGPWLMRQLNFEKTQGFVETIDWSMINACGFYGGEPGVLIPLYEKFVALIPSDVPRFTITNGTWSRSEYRTDAFMEFAFRNRLQVFVSATPYHLPHQDAAVIEAVCKYFSSFKVKGDDKIIPMGRASKDPWGCSFRCGWDKRPTRFALKPGGDIIFQSCDGVYPVVQTYDEPFSHLVTSHLSVIEGCQKKVANTQSSAQRVLDSVRTGSE